MKKRKLSFYIICLALCLFSIAACTARKTPSLNPNGTIEREDEPSEYPKTEIVPGFDLDEPDEPVD